MDEPAPDGKSTPRYVTWRDGRWRDATLEPCWYATMDDVLGCRTVPPDYPKRFCNSVELLWGPIRAEVARLCQAPAAAASVLLRVDVCKKTLEQVEHLIPEQVRCRPEDTADSLCRRLADCCWLDSLQVLKGGCGPGYVALNTTTYASPRRVSWSVVVRPQHVDADGDEVLFLFAYTHVGRKPEDCRARAMPLPVFDLGLQLWEAAFPVLSTESQLHPPTACQMLLYYDLFGPKNKNIGGRMGRHRDNFNSSDAVDALIHGKDVLQTSTGHAISADGNSQKPRSDVLIWTSEGSRPMILYLSFPRRLSEECIMERNKYITHPNFMVKCDGGSLFVFKHMDDLHFAHEVKFAGPDEDTSPTPGHRFAYVFRWLELKHSFYTDFDQQHGMKLNEEQCERQCERQRERQRERKRAR